MKYIGHLNCPDLSVDYAGVVRLWILKILNTPGGLSKSIISAGFRGDDMAVFVGLEEFIEVPIPDKGQREKAFHRICGKTVSSQSALRISRSEQVAPALVARAVKVIETIKEDIPEAARDDAFEHLIENTLKTQGQRDGLKGNLPTLPEKARGPFPERHAFIFPEKPVS